MRILHTNMLRGWGGQSNRILTEALGAQRHGHDIALAVPHDSKLAEKGRDAGFDVWPGYTFRPPAQPWKFLPDLRRLMADVRRWRPDLIHIHGSQDTWAAVLAKSLSRGGFPPLIRTKHNIFEWKSHTLNRWLYARIDAFISISGFIDRQLEDHPSIHGQPRALIHSVPDLARLRQRAAPMRREIDALGEKTFLWGSTGRLRSEKAFDVLLRAFARVRRERPDCYLVIAGDGSERARLDVQARELGLDDSCFQFLGFRQDVPAILKSLDGYVLPSRSEGLGTAILEALAVGLPVVATNVGGIPDSVRHEETGLLVEQDDTEAIARAMVRMMDEESLRQRLGENARRMVDTEFTEDRLVEKTLDFYQHVLDLNQP